MKVLIPTDGSKYAKWAMAWVGGLPFAEVPAVTVLHVTDIGSLRGPFMFQSVVAGTEPFVQEEINRVEARKKRVLAEARRQMNLLNLKGTILTERGSVSQTILERAAKRDGLIALGCRGLDALDRFLLGSVSARVALHATCPVLIVKKSSRPLRRLLFATDGSKASDKALRFLLTKLQAQGRKGDAPIEVIVAHVIPLLNSPELKEAGGQLVKDSAAKLAKAGYVVRPAVRVGKTVDQILKVASGKKVDLIVTGAKGVGAVAQFLLGSISAKLVQHSSCSVLLIR
ncbi:MAG TPA: universal stress protein [Nitrospira sp.]|nr:universal stress protein [Nitrospira sp.]